MGNEETIFAEALSRGSAPEREAYLDAACAGDAQMRRAVEALLRAHGRAGGILEVPPAGLGLAEPTDAASQGIGSIIGPYKLLEQIGGGGMGIVYMAEQLRPVRRKVALKIIRPGMDSAQVIARFEAERQALTMMDHPNIARVLDAGTTDAGRPYFVMELVKGIPITDYCDQARLTTGQRLELFVQVCNAVQHAHQKGIIHRDLKPTNVLVTLHDERPVPKVIDFGIAKATAGAGHVLTDRTLFTHFAQMLGTPLYMSPEQAQLSGLDVDTRSDVYSLGVLLYELLTGTTPFDQARLRAAAYDEMRRIIREEDPPRPSTRLSTMGGSIASISANRDTEPKKLSQLVRGELDWIVMKALEKDRRRRFETAIGLARDVERYLNNEAVEACPPSTTYWLRKFVRRNRAALLATMTLLAMLLSLVVGLAVSNRMIAAERNEKAKALTLAEAQRQRAETNFWKAAVSVRDIVTNVATGKSELPAATRQTFTAAATKFYEGLMDDNSPDPSRQFETAIGHRSIAIIHASAGKVEESHRASRQAIAHLEGLSADVPDNYEYLSELATTRMWFSRTLDSAGKTQEGADQRARAREGYEQALSRGPDSFYVLSWTARLISREAVDHARAGRMEEFEKLFPRLIELCERAEKAPRDFVKYPKGIDYHRMSGHTFRLLAFDLQSLNLHEEAEQSLRRAIAVFDRAHEEEPDAAIHYRYAADTRRRAGESLLWRNQLAEAEFMLRDARQRYSTNPAAWADQPPNPEGLSSTHFALAALLANTARRAEAADCMTRGLAVDAQDERHWREAALLYLITDDLPRYRHACGEILDRFTDTAQKDPDLAARVVRACAAAPNAVNDFSRVRTLANGAVAGAGKDKAPRSLVLAKGLADYRAGDFSVAIDWLEASGPKPGGAHEDAAAFAAMAMSHERLGRRQEARDALAAARRSIAGKPQGRFLADWYDWLHAEVLVREAETLLTESPAKP